MRSTVIAVAALPLAYGLVEMGATLRIASLFAFRRLHRLFRGWSVDLLISLALGWSARNRARLGVMLAVVLCVPAAASLWLAV